jgi:hypothetical protein
LHRPTAQINNAYRLGVVPSQFMQQIIHNNLHYI